MAEPSVKRGKTRAQLDAQLGRISTAMERAYETATDGDMSRIRNRWFNATRAYGRLSGDDEQIQSIIDYRPESRMFTSREEMERLNRHFGLEKRTVESLMALRNNVVDTYARLGRRDDGMMQWMQSVTAVIDYYIRRKGVDV